MFYCGIQIVLFPKSTKSSTYCWKMVYRSPFYQAEKILFTEINTSNLTVYHPSTPPRIPPNSTQQPSKIDLLLSNGIYAVSGISMRTALSLDHLTVLHEVEVTVQREVPKFFFIDYNMPTGILFAGF
jgi:hypothetical protein